MIPQRQPAQAAKGDQTIIIVALATAKRQKMETGAATGPCCKKMAIEVVPQITTTSP